MSKNIDFKKRINALRPYERVAKQPWQHDDYLEYVTRQMESDRGRIINSPAIRRLQQKTQVFPLERNATVRSRLTHSLEVQQTGRFITRTIFTKLSELGLTKQYGLDDLERILESIVEMACLSHDIGNPPFGHFGEYAINSWFDKNIEKINHFESSNQNLIKKMVIDLKNFEGNAQAIRLVNSLLTLNLTYTQTACLIKYVRPAYLEKPEKKSPGAYLRKKPGFYLSEEKFVKQLWSKLDMPEGARHPATWIMEAADDISYGLADIEDAVEKGIIHIPQLKEMLIEEFQKNGDVNSKAFSTPMAGEQSFREIVEYADRRFSAANINQNNEFFLWLRVNLIHSLVQHAAQRFIDNIEHIYTGDFDEALMEDNSPGSHAIEALKSVAIKKVFNNKEVETLELQGYRVIYGLIEIYSPLLKCSQEIFRRIIDQEKGTDSYLKKLASRLAERHVKAYKKSIDELSLNDDYKSWEIYYRCRLIQDFISGMTDQFAYDEYRTLTVASDN
ncbi:MULTISPECIES: dGTPase [Halomonadaceae]|uniref:dGTPase n=1 Tax=Halomonadaceae TaxID=28256 RepID=UPI000C31C5F0|nr:dGTPase [Halomonas sp. MES3-P3E]PKG47257.1 dGTPase [Halomonas sp. MES3-P3E]|tara:strand:- start:955 stop:2463 length:1509 start_codon:yes stop_codon:yes gene_type:complete